ncbi:glycosyltransferase family 4 protein [Algoriphagus aquimarinus]|uniref:Glycosyltransferase involved in cell wall bisynthesis n=1 Tax=Algoriphagus aquimarinus TaxID=237018 RepID=A0A1I1AUW8_9BACT|nr:glycosyltransferase family 4 protein [Algoriphagus aquimarinus]SFB41677.1 Glycosyltransferase involved in cell wall bisynthesis [Algoriphagus aquimarinus]
MGSRKILIITYEYLPVIGGAGIYAEELYNGLNAKEISVDLLLLSKQSKNVLQKGYFILRSMFLLCAAFRKNYDTIVINDGRSKRLYALLFPFIRSKDVKKGVFVMHGGELENYFEKPSTMMKIFNLPQKIKKILPLQKAVIVVSQSENDSWRNLMSELQSNLKVIPHGISSKIFYPKSESERLSLRKTMNLQSDDFVIFSVSRLVEKKGQDTLIQAVANIKEKTPRLKILIAGDGLFKNNLIHHAINMTVQDNIVFLGFLERNTLIDYFNIADLFVLPSRFLESFGLVYIESMACGTPVISSNLGGVNDIVQQGKNGFKITPGDYQELGKVILELYSDKAKLNMLKNNALTIFRDKYDVSKMIDKFLHDTD